MGKKGRKTRWRKLPIPIGPQGGEEVEDSGEREEKEQPPPHHPRVTFNEDEYTKITTPRQDMLFKKGYLNKKRTTNSSPQQLSQQDTADSQSAQSADSVESEQYICEDPVQQYIYPPPTGYIDHTGVYFLNNNAYEVYDPYTGNVTVIVGPSHYAGGQPVLAAVPCQPVPLQHVEWFNPVPPQCSPVSRKKQSSPDSQNCSAPSSESTCPPSSPQEPLEDAPGIVYPPQYVYPGYMFGAPLYNVNGVSVQGVVPPSVFPADTKQRRKKRRRRRRGGVTDEGSESSCEEQLSCEVGVESQSGASSDAGPGSSCSKTNSDSGVHTDPTPNSGTNSPQLQNSEQLEFLGHVEEDSCKALSSLNDDYAKNIPPSPLSPISRSSVDETSTETALESSLLPPDPIPMDRAAIPSIRVISEEKLVISETEEAVILTDGLTEVPSMSDLKQPSEEFKKEGKTDHIIKKEYNLEEILPQVENLKVEELSAEVCVEKPVTKTELRPLGGKSKKVVKFESKSSKSTRRGKKAGAHLKEINKLASALANTIIEQSIGESNQKMRRAHPITEAVTKWLESQGERALSSPNTESEDEGIDEEEEAILLTGQKNVDGNPFLVPSLSGSGIRVANDCLSLDSSAGEWDFYDSIKCDPAESVDKYYRLSEESPRNPKVIKTAVHFHRAGPFPCGVCCLIQ